MNPDPYMKGEVKKMIDWSRQVGQKVDFRKGRAVLIAYLPEATRRTWVLDDGKATWLTVFEPTLIEWKPEIDEWVMGQYRTRPGNMLRDGYPFKFHGRHGFSSIRPITDDEIIEIGKGVENLRRIVAEADDA